MRKIEDDTLGFSSGYGDFNTSLHYDNYGYGRGYGSGEGYEDAAGGYCNASFGVVCYASGGGSRDSAGMGVGYGTYEYAEGTGGELNWRQTNG